MNESWFLIMSLSSVCNTQELFQLILEYTNDKRPLSIVFGKYVNTSTLYSFVFSVHLFETYTVAELMHMRTLIDHIDNVAVVNNLSYRSEVRQSIPSKFIPVIREDHEMNYDQLMEYTRSFDQFTKHYKDYLNRELSRVLKKKICQACMHDPLLFLMSFIVMMFAILF